MDWNTNDLPSQGQCLECGKEIPYGRSDRKFCTPQCKNSFHNRERDAVATVKRETLLIMEKNYDVLMDVLRKGFTSIPLQHAKSQGFNKDFTTGTFNISRGRRIFFCYDICYHISSSKIYGIRHSSVLAMARMFKVGLDYPWLSGNWDTIRERERQEVLSQSQMDLIDEFC